MTSLGFGLWLDKNYEISSVENLSKNHWTPEVSEDVVREALRLSDE